MSKSITLVDMAAMYSLTPDTLPPESTFVPSPSVYTAGMK